MSNVQRLDVQDLGLPQSRQWPDEVPAVRIGRLASAADRHHRSLGGRLLRDAVQKVLDMREQVATVLLVVDALDDEVAGFYATRGFTSIAGRRLVAPVKDLASILQQP